jgi:hypothetical protein
LLFEKLSRTCGKIVKQYITLDFLILKRVNEV